MAQSGFITFILFLGLVVSNVYGDNTKSCDQILKDTVHKDSPPDFKLTISPDKLLSNTNYTVQLEGTGNFSVILQAITQSSSVGNWTEEDKSCNGSAFFADYDFSSKKSIKTTWKSPDSLAEVTIKAYINNGTDTFLLQQQMKNESTSTTTSTTKGTPTHHPEKTTSAGHIDQSSLVPMALIVFLGLLLIPNKYLS